MGVTIKVVEVNAKHAIVEAYDADKRRILRSPVAIQSKERAKIEQAVRQQLKMFNAPLWGGMTVFFEQEKQS